jgi:integrase/recombinase XerD
MKLPVQLYLRVRLPDGIYPYLKVAYASNGRIRPNHAVHNLRYQAGKCRDGYHAA